MDEDIGRPLPARDEAEPAKPIEPFHLRPFETACWSHGNMGPRRRHLRRMNRRRFIHGDDAERLQAFGARQHLADDARALIGGLVAVAAQAGHMQKHVAHAIVGHDEAITLGHVEPFDDAGHFNDLRRGLIGEIDLRPKPHRYLSFDSVRGHDAEAAVFSVPTPRGRFTNLTNFLKLKITFAVGGKSTKMQHTAKTITPCEHRWMTRRRQMERIPCRYLHAQRDRQCRRSRSVRD